MFNTLGYEYSLLASLFCSIGAGHLAAMIPKERTNDSLPVLCLGSLAQGLVLVLAFLLVSLVNSLITPPCNIWSGLGFFVLMPAASVLPACAVGLFCGLVAPTSRIAGALWIIIFIASLVGAFARFYWSPAVFLYGPFFGFFPGVLYDKLVHVGTPFITYRIATLAQTAFVLGASAWYMTRRRGAAAFSVASLIVVVCFHLAGPSLGHRTERADLEQLLKQKVSTKKLDLYFTPGTDLKLVQKLKDDAVFSLDQVEQYLDVEMDRPIAVFFFSSVAQKAKAMGAAGTNVAKPWRSEVYVIAKAPPHRVLRHELAHIVAAKFGKGPFAIAGAWGGLWPNPGFIEGLAVSAQGPRGDLTPHQWAAAMKRLKLLPPIEGIFSLGFFNYSASSAYTTAGSFCAWAKDMFGSKALRTAYKTSDWKEATGQELFQLSKQWLEFIDNMELDEADLAAAAYRFDRPAIIHSVCVHEVAALKKEASIQAAMDNWDRALALYDEAHERSGRSTQTKKAKIFAHIDAGMRDEIKRRRATILKDTQLGIVTKNTIREVLADWETESQKTQRTREEYLELAQKAAFETARRTLHVKAYLAGHQSKSVRQLIKIFARRPGQDAIDQSLAMLMIAEAASEFGDDPVIKYLLARQHFRFDNWQRALVLLGQVIKDENLKIESVKLEAKMIYGQSLHFLKRYDEAKELFDSIANDSKYRDGTRGLAKDWSIRSMFFKHR